MGLFDGLISSFVVCGIISPYSLMPWMGTDYIKNIREEFKLIQKEYNKNGYDAVGVLRLIDNSLYPEFYILNKDGSAQAIKCETEPIELDLLIKDEETLKEVKESQILIVEKFPGNNK